MKHALSLVVVVVLISLPIAAGCLGERLYMDPNRTTPENGAVGLEGLERGRLSGDFGPRRGFDGDATEMEARSDPDFAASRVIVARGTAMVIISTNGIMLNQLQPGVYEYENDAASVETAPVAMNVCSGEDSWSIDYDRPAERVTVTVANTPEGRSFTFDTEAVPERSSDEIETSSTSFVIGRTAPAESDG